MEAWANRKASKTMGGAVSRSLWRGAVQIEPARIGGVSTRARRVAPDAARQLTRFLRFLRPPSDHSFGASMTQVSLYMSPRWPACLRQAVVFLSSGLASLQASCEISGANALSAQQLPRSHLSRAGRPYSAKFGTACAKLAPMSAHVGRIRAFPPEFDSFEVSLVGECRPTPDCRK